MTVNSARLVQVSDIFFSNGQLFFYFVGRAFAFCSGAASAQRRQAVFLEVSVSGSFVQTWYSLRHSGKRSSILLSDRFALKKLSQAQRRFPFGTTAQKINRAFLSLLTDTYPQVLEVGRFTSFPLSFSWP
jgi:hypothetical protein